MYDKIQGIEDELDNLPSDMPSNNTFGESTTEDEKEDTATECRGETENPATRFKTGE